MEQSRSYLLEDREKAKEESLRLKAQARMLFELELSALKKVGLDLPKCILDIGCGNGSYLELLALQFPNCQLVGVDRNTTLLEDLELVSKAKTKVLDITHSESLASVIQEFRPDTLISRYVLQHLSATGMSQILKSVKENCDNSGRLILIDTNDLEIRFDPPCNALSAFIALKGKKQSELGGNRAIGSKLKSLLQGNGFRDIREAKLEFTNCNLGWDTWMAVFWPVLQSGLPEAPTNEQKELLRLALSWFECAKKDNAYLASWPVYYVSGK